MKPPSAQRRHLLLASISACLLVALLISWYVVPANGGESRGDQPVGTEQVQDSNSPALTARDSVASEQPVGANTGQPEPASPGAASPDSSQQSADPSLSPEWVGSLKAAALADQIVIVEAFPNSSEAMLSLYSRQPDSTWKKDMSGVRAFVGEAGVGLAREGSTLTPVGTFYLPSAFGIADSPGTLLPYTKVTDDLYWVGDSSSQWYNQLVSDKVVSDFDKSESEHLIEAGKAYDYAIEIGYNFEHIPGAGSAFFLHCTSGTETYTEGCVAVPEDVMVSLLRQLRPGAVIVIGTKEDIVASAVAS